MKKNSALNVLNKAEVQKIWIPYVIFKVERHLLYFACDKSLLICRTPTQMKLYLWRVWTAPSTWPGRETSPGLVWRLWTRRRCSRDQRTRSLWSRRTAKSFSVPTSFIIFHLTLRFDNLRHKWFSVMDRLDLLRPYDPEDLWPRYHRFDSWANQNGLSSSTLTIWNNHMATCLL